MIACIGRDLAGLRGNVRSALVLHFYRIGTHEMAKSQALRIFKSVDCFARLTITSCVGASDYTSCVSTTTSRAQDVPYSKLFD